MGPAKIKHWFEKRGVPVKSVETLKQAGTPIILGYSVKTKAGKVGKLGADARAYELENLRRTFV